MHNFLNYLTGCLRIYFTCPYSGIYSCTASTSKYTLYATFNRIEYYNEVCIERIKIRLD